MAKPREVVSRRPGEAEERVCNVCHAVKSIDQFYARRVNPSLLAAVRKSRGNSISLRMPCCVSCHNRDKGRQQQLKRLRGLSPEKLALEKERVRALLALVEQVEQESTAVV